MKIRNILAVLLIISVFCALTACSSDKDTPLSGKYGVVDITDDPDGVTFAELDAMYKEIGVEIVDFTYIEFFEDNTYSLVVFGDEEASGTYAKDGNTLMLTTGGVTITAEISGDKITWTYETGAKLVFEKMIEGEKST
jgi:ABC-type oligopeptide transport system substrate-binding subunit